MGLRRTALGLGVSGALGLVSPALRAEEPPLEVTVHGPSAGGFVSRTSTDSTLREPIDAASLLAELPGVHVRRLGADGAFAALSVRGSASSQVGVFLAGIPLTSAADPSLDVGSLPLWPGASFRVYRGFAPASLGTTGYLGGVLAIDPPSPAVGERTEAWAAAGSFGSLKLRLGDLRRLDGGVEVGTGLFASRTDGDFSYVQPDPVSGKPVSFVRQNAGLATVGGISRVAVSRPWGSVAALIFADTRQGGVPGSAIAPTSFVSLQTSRLVAGLEATLRTGDASSLHLLGWGRREASTLDDPRGEIEVHAASTKSEILAAGLSASFRVKPLPALSIQGLLDGRAERFVPVSTEGMLASVEASRLAGGAGAEVEWRPTDRLTVSGSLRLDARQDDASGARLIAAGSASPDTGGLTPTGHAGASYRFLDALVASAHVGALSRPPGFTELYGNGANLVANPLLRKERGLSADAGLHGDLGTSDAAFSYEAVGFVTESSDLITLLPLGATTFKATNVDAALLAGAELTAALTTRHARLSASYTLLLTRNQSDLPGERGAPLPGRPAHDLAYDAAFFLGPAGARYSLDVVAGTTVDGGGAIVLPARVLHGLGAWLDVPGVTGLRAAVDVQNLFDLRLMSLASPLTGASVDKPISDFLGFPLPGRAVWVTLRYRMEP